MASCKTYKQNMKLFDSTNPLTPTHIVKEAKLTLSKEASKAMGVGTYVPRQKEAGEATPATNDLWKRSIYKTGDGNHNTYVPRPGSLKAFSLPSRGL